MLYIPYNTGLIKQQKSLILKRLKEQKEILKKLQSEGSLNLLSKVIDEIHIAKNNLKMAALNEWYFLDKVEEVLLLSKSQKAPPEAIKVVIEAINDFINYFDSKVDKLLKQGENDLYLIELFPNYMSLCEMLGEKAKIRDLFFPIPEITKEFISSFKNFEPTQLKVKTETPYTDFVAATDEYLSYLARQDPSDVPEAKNALAKMIKVVAFYKRLQAKPHYYGYLVGLLGRLKLAHLREFGDLNFKSRMYEILSHAKTEMQKFRGVEKAPDPEAVRATMYDFIFEDKIKAQLSDTYVQEAYQLFNIQKFIYKAKANVDSSEKKRKQSLKSRVEGVQKLIRALIKNLELMREALNNGETVGNVLVASAKNLNSGFYRGFIGLMEKKVAPDIYNALSKIDSVDTATITFIKEYIALYHILDVYLEQVEDVSEAFVSVLKEQCKRAIQSIEGVEFEDNIDWVVIGRSSYLEDRAKLYSNVMGVQRQASEAILAIVIEKNTRENKAVKEQQSENALRLLSNLLAIFTISKQQKITELLSLLRKEIFDKKIEGAFVFTEEEKERHLKIIQGVALYIEALQRNDTEPEKLIESLHAKLCGKEDIVEELSAEYEEDIEEQEVVKKTQMKFGFTDENLTDTENKDLEISAMTKEEMLKDVETRSKLNDSVGIISVSSNLVETEVAEEQSSLNFEEAVIAETATEIVEDLNNAEVISRQDLDDEIMEVLSTQFNELNERLPKNLAKLRARPEMPDYRMARNDLKRFSHTLKGDLRTVGLYKLGKLYETSEFLLKDKLESENHLTDDFLNHYEKLLAFNNGLFREFSNKYYEGNEIIRVNIDPNIVSEFNSIFSEIEHEKVVSGVVVSEQSDEDLIVEAMEGLGEIPENSANSVETSDIVETVETETTLETQSLVDGLTGIYPSDTFTTFGANLLEETSEEAKNGQGSEAVSLETENVALDEVVLDSRVSLPEEVNLFEDLFEETGEVTSSEQDSVVFGSETEEVGALEEKVEEGLPEETGEVAIEKRENETVAVETDTTLDSETKTETKVETVENLGEEYSEISESIKETTEITEVVEDLTQVVQKVQHTSTKVLDFNIEENEENLETVVSLLTSLDNISKEVLNVKDCLEKLLFNKQ